MHKTILRLEEVAKKNNDSFRYKIEITPRGNSVRYTFVCEEDADGHAFCSASGLTPELAMDAAYDAIPECCHVWGYKLPE